MIDHTGISVSDFKLAAAFYEAAFNALGGGCVLTLPDEQTGGMRVAGYGIGSPVFWVSGSGEKQTPPVHVAFAATDRKTVDAFYKAAMAAGGRDNGAPGPRPHYHPHYYAAFVLDPDGNNIEAVCRVPQEA